MKFEAGEYSTALELLHAALHTHNEICGERHLEAVRLRTFVHAIHMPNFAYVQAAILSEIGDAATELEALHEGEPHVPTKIFGTARGLVRMGNTVGFGPLQRATLSMSQASVRCGWAARGMRLARLH